MWATLCRTTDFRYDGNATDYSVTLVNLGSETNPTLRITFDPSAETVFDEDKLVLYVDDTAFNFVDATFVQDQFEWTGTGLNWSDGETVDLVLSAPRPVPVTIEAEHESIGGGVEDLKYTLTRTGATTDALTVTVTLTQDQNWLTSTYLTHEVEFAAGEATKELIIEDSRFSFDPTTSGNLVATVTGTGVDGGTDTVVVISIADPPITIAFDKDAYSFPEGGPANEVDIYLTATLDAAFPRKPSSNFYVAISTEEGTATGPEDYAIVSRTPSFEPTDFTANAAGQQVASLLFGPSVGNPLVIVDDDVYEVDETFNVEIEFTAGPFDRAWLASRKPTAPSAYLVLVVAPPSPIPSPSPTTTCRRCRWPPRRRASPRRTMVHDHRHVRERLHRDGGDHQRQDLRGGPDGHADLLRGRHPGHPLQREPGGHGYKRDGPPGGSGEGDRLG